MPCSHVRSGRGGTALTLHEAKLEGLSGYPEEQYDEMPSQAGKLVQANEFFMIRTR